MNTKDLENILLKEKKIALKDCWEYHKEILKREGKCESKTELEDFLYVVDLQGWENVGFFVGYLRGLDFALEILNEKVKNKTK